MNLLFNMLLPFATMGVMNYMIYRAMNRTHMAARRSRYANAGANAASSSNGTSAGVAYGVPTRFYSSGRTRNGRRFALGRQTSSLLRRVNMGGEQQQQNGQVS